MLTTSHETKKHLKFLLVGLCAYDFLIRSGIEANGNYYLDLHNIDKSMLENTDNSKGGYKYIEEHTNIKDKNPMKEKIQ